ncbi:MAG: hypothetical protein SGILL_004395 [Bacillariaceae sp.]
MRKKCIESFSSPPILHIVAHKNKSSPCLGSDAILEAGDDHVRTSLQRLLCADQTEFRSPHDINRLLNDPSNVFSYKKFLTRTDALIGSWIHAVLGEPVLYEVYFGTTDKEKVQRLKDSRQRLGDHVEDPLPEVAAIAAKARRRRQLPSIDDSDDSDEEEKQQTRKRKGSMLDKKKSAKRMDFDDDGEDGDDDGDDEDLEDPEEESNAPALRSPGERMRMHNAGKTSPLKKQRKSQEKTYEGRRMWSDAEINALKDGIREFGTGKWAQIKEYYPIVLKDRTSGQIKVCIHWNVIDRE